jgi:PKD repeat protein
VVGFYYSPADPSVFDTIQFYDQSYDGARVGIALRSWSFGDGVEADGCCPTHRYPVDGAYTLTLTVTTADGRVDSRSRDVVVETHDVAVARVAVPRTASVGETATITIGLTNARYPETVRVRLLKSVAERGWSEVGELTREVPVLGGRRTTDFAFDYTFTREDARLGTVEFRAVAAIQGARDAVPADNTSTSQATEVTAV